MTVRQKLVELLRGCVFDYVEVTYDPFAIVRIGYENIADYLRDNGVEGAIPMDGWQKLVELLRGVIFDNVEIRSGILYIGCENIADYLIANGVTVQ